MHLPSRPTAPAPWPMCQLALVYRCPRCSTCRKSLRPGESDRAVATASTPSGGASTTSFIYNALGERVQLVAPTYTYNYPFDAFGQEIGIHNSSTGWGHYTVEMAGRRIFLSVSATRSRTSTRRTSACSPPTRAAGSAPTQRPAAAGTHKIITGTLTFAPTPPMG